MARELFLRPFCLVDIGQILDETLRQHVWSGLMELMQKHVWARDFLKPLESIIPVMQQLETLQAEGPIIQAVRYSFFGSKMENPEPLVSLLKRQFSRKVGEEAMIFADILRKEGREEGMQQGLEQGRLASQEDMARKLLLEGTEPGFVARVTDLSPECVQMLVLQLSAVE